MDSYYTILEFASKLRVHPNTIRRAIKSGHINAFKVNTGLKSSYRISHVEIERMALKEMNGIIFKIAKEKTIGVDL